MFNPQAPPGAGMRKVRASPNSRVNTFPMSTQKRFVTALVLFALPAMALAGEGMNEGGMTSRMMMLAIQLGIILFLAKIGNVAFEKLHLPGVLGELCTGVLIGPFLLGSIPLPAFPHGLFPAAAASFPISPELYGLCSVAAVVLLFMAGLETNIPLFLRYSVAGAMVGVGGVVVSFFSGSLLAMALSPWLFEKQLGFFAPPCLFLGIISTATSVGITARLLSENRKLDSPEGVTILAGAVIDDVLGIILLAVGLGVIGATREGTGVHWSHIGGIAAKTVGIWAVATVVGLTAARHISRLLKWFGDRATIATLALGLALMVGGLFEEAGLAMIIGAYVTGLSLSRSDIRHLVREKTEPVYAFLVPIFFTVMGMLVDMRLFASPRVLGFGLLYTVTALAAKMIGCALPAMACGFNLRGGLRIGAGMLPRGEVALIVAGIGMASGLMSADVFSVAVMMTLLTTLCTPPAIVALFRRPGSGKRRPEVSTVAKPLVFAFPSDRTAEILVTKLLEVFAREGFYVHTLSREDCIYQALRDAMRIDFCRRGAAIEFECHGGETALVSTALLEVLAEFEQTVRELRNPVDRTAVLDRMQASAGASDVGTPLAPYLAQAVLEPRLQGGTKAEIIEELIGRLAAGGAVRDPNDARTAVWAREESMSTGMAHGLALPHGRTDAVDRIVFAVGIRREGVDFSSMDGKPANIIVLSLSPRTASAPHVQFMSAISRTMNERMRALLLSCATEEEMRAILAGSAAGAVRPRRRWADLFHAGESPEAWRQSLSPLCAAHRLGGRTREEVVVELLKRLRASGVINEVPPAGDAVLNREHLAATGLDHGIAIPHVVLPTIRRLSYAIGLHPEGVDFGAPDGRPSRIVVLTLIPPGGTPDYAYMLSELGRVLDDAGQARLRQARTDAELYAEWMALVSRP